MKYTLFYDWFFCRYTGPKLLKGFFPVHGMPESMYCTEETEIQKIDESVKKKAHIVPENFDDVKDITASRVCFKILTHHINSASICQTIYDKRSK